MKTPHLIKMANQIGQFFQSEPDQDQAVKDVASHLKKFWDPRMRKAIVSHVESGGDGLIPIVLKAIRENRQILA